MARLPYCRRLPVANLAPRRIAPAERTDEPMDRRRTNVRHAWLAALAAGLAALLAAAPASPPAAADEAPAARAARLDGDAERTRLTVEFDRAVPFRIFALADPYRVIVDLPQVAFLLPAGTGQTGAGLVSAYRYGLIMVGKSRIVLDTEKPVRIESAGMEEGADGGPARLVVELVATSRTAFLAELDRQRAPLPPVRPAPARATDEAPALRTQGADDFIVVIDPGHGGIDAGAVGIDGVQEKEIVLAFSRVLKEELERTGRYQVLLTRDSDVFLSLRERVEFARRNNAALFISVHADKFRGRSVRGATVYTVSEEASDAETAALAAKENKADVIAGLDLEAEPDEVTDILISLAQRETKNLSMRFAKGLVGSLRRQVDMNRNPHRFAGFRVLRAPDVPSVLLELGYVSNADDVRAMSSPAWRGRAAAAMIAAIDQFRAGRFAGALD